MRVKWYLVAVATVVWFAGPACEAVGPGSGPDDTPDFISYYPEQAFYVAGADKVVVMGYYEGHGALAGCSLDSRLWVRHVFRFDQAGALHPDYLVPAREEAFTERITPLAATADAPLELSSMGLGQLTVLGGTRQYQAEREPYTIVCARVEFSMPTREEVVTLSLICGGCGGHRCYDGNCDSDEDEVSCPADCLTQASPCGDLYCGSGEQYECREDCRCDDQLCAMKYAGADDSLCIAVWDEPIWAMCQGFLNLEPCDGSEPFCLSHGGDGIPDELIQRCDPDTGLRIRRGCDQECWERHGTTGICDMGGTEECICD